MRLLALFITFSISYAIADWIIRKTDFHNKLLGKHGKNKYYRTILIIVLFFFIFSLEYVKQLVDKRYGHPNYISLIIGAFIGSICINFGTGIFRRSKSW